MATNVQRSVRSYHCGETYTIAEVNHIQSIVESSITPLSTDLEEQITNLETHVNNEDNPHEVNIDDVGASAVKIVRW